MKILYDKEQGVALSFPPKEFKFALLILKAIYRAAPMDFVKTCIDDMEKDMAPKLLPMINYKHLCESCYRIIDERDENTMRFQKNDDVKYKCRVCKPLRKDRPR